MEVNVGLAILAGMAAFLSPCVFSIIPPFMANLGGRSSSVLGVAPGIGAFRWRIIGHGLLFLAGFSFLFIVPRIATAGWGGVIYTFRDWLSKLGGVLVVLLGLKLMGIFNLLPKKEITNWFQSSRRINGYIGSGLVGMFFSAGWSPCVGPVLGAILTLGMNGEMGRSLPLLSSFCAGLAVPFLLIAVIFGLLGTLVSKSKQAVRIVEKSSGVLLIVLGGMLFLGTFEQLARFGSFVNLGL